METREWIMIFLAAITVIGWFIDSSLNRKHEIFKKRLDYRLKMLESYVLVVEVLEKLFNHNQIENSENLAKEFIEKLEKAQTYILIYGTKKEVEIIGEITVLAQKNKHIDLKNKSGEFMCLIRKNIRSELGIENT